MKIKSLNCIHNTAVKTGVEHKEGCNKCIPDKISNIIVIVISNVMKCPDLQCTPYQWTIVWTTIQKIEPGVCIILSKAKNMIVCLKSVQCGNPSDRKMWIAIIDKKKMIQ